MNIERLFFPRKSQKARKFSKEYQTVDVGRPLKGEWLSQICFVLFVDKLEFLG